MPSLSHQSSTMNNAGTTSPTSTGGTAQQNLVMKLITSGVEIPDNLEIDLFGDRTQPQPFQITAITSAIRSEVESQLVVGDSTQNPLEFTGFIASDFPRSNTLMGDDDMISIDDLPVGSLGDDTLLGGTSSGLDTLVGTTVGMDQFGSDTLTGGLDDNTLMPSNNNSIFDLANISESDTVEDKVLKLIEFTMDKMSEDILVLGNGSGTTAQNPLIQNEGNDNTIANMINTYNSINSSIMDSIGN